MSVFLALATQWRIVAGVGGVMYQGIDVVAVEPVLRLLGIKKKRWSGIFESLMTMSNVAASVINEKQKSK